ncbi:hypothetical protein NQ315_000611 [Exocentrus adspersus]|uniref:Uncharacterized protein n=1 Tax=Exocentrus adspersus TaxID=1586481 RepID=A0AAV8VMY1_9CUCU|nr:hypothetical protein NQ315_000611 [Exocentrus adspersus]
MPHQLFIRLNSLKNVCPPLSKENTIADSCDHTLLGTSSTATAVPSTEKLIEVPIYIYKYHENILLEQLTYNH